MSSQLDDSNQDELFEHHRIQVDPGQSPLRIDKFLIDRIPNTSRNKLQEAAKAGFIKANGVEVKSNYKVKPSEVITVELPYPVREIELIPEDIPLHILYEDDQIIVVNKQANMVVHPGYGNYTGTLVNGLIHHFQKLPLAKGTPAERPGLVHRLDKHTTGVMVVGKTEEAMMDLSRQFFERTSERRYWALVWGDVSEDGTIVGNLGRSPKNRKLMTVFEEGEAGKHAVTHYKSLKRFGYVSLVECKLETGRTHQIRAHMKHLGHPLFNDLEYGGDKVLKGTTFTKYKQFVDNCFKLIPGQALHAKTLGFTHPKTKEWMSFDSDLPKGFQEILEKWEHYLAHRKD
ncbi:MAG: RluA family pseudouridine synthase [Flavobacteriales bacterium]|nr:RluA family pseudouridine synthase [Flavobacteriales bacterium]